MTEDEIRRVLQEMRNDPVPADSLARARLTVNDRRAAKSRLSWFSAIAAAAALATLLVMFRAEPVSVPAAPPTRRPPVVSEARTEKPDLPVRKVAAIKKHKTRPSVKPQADPLVVRIETEDPDVVILLFGD